MSQDKTQLLDVFHYWTITEGYTEASSKFDNNAGLRDLNNSMFPSLLQDILKRSDWDKLESFLLT